jgi:3-deoxy-manno-octulosonate cytidylyltransferase (CMP-KDO synthetase)
VNNKNVIIAVPARLESSRLPGKVLLDIQGKPMLRRVLDACQESMVAGQVVLCTDSDLILSSSRHWGYRSISTPKECTSGTDRISVALNQILDTIDSKLEDTLILNVQADQPLIDPILLNTVVRCSLSDADTWHPVSTPVYRLSREAIHDPHIVKVLRSTDGAAITFSRSALPFVRDYPNDQWHQHAAYWGHIGIYSYRSDILAKWGTLPSPPIEYAEKLEQLRLINAGIKIHTFEVESDCLSVDTESQLSFVRRQVAMKPL